MAYDSGPTYIPTEDEIKLRIDLTYIMATNEWDAFVMDEIMHNDNPTIDTVFRLIRTYGHEEAYKRLKRFLK